MRFKVRPSTIDENRCIMVINSLTIIIIAGIGFAMYFSYRLGEEVGYDRGNAEGRKALRKQFMEQVNQ